MTMGIMRLIEGALAQSCDYTQNGDLNKGLTQFNGSSTLRTILGKMTKFEKATKCASANQPTLLSTSTTSLVSSWTCSAHAPNPAA